MVWIGKFKKEDETLDYTDAGKNVPEIKTNYSVTKEGFIEFKNNPENRINLDFNNNSTSNTENSSNNSLKFSGSQAFISPSVEPKGKNPNCAW